MKPIKSEFPQALRSFMGHLEGTGKALHTIKNYRLDLLSFADFLGTGRPRAPLRELPQKEIERFHDHLKKLGLKTNTRRRKVLTVSKFLRYLAGRNKVDQTLARRMPAPPRVERVPFTLPYAQLAGLIQAMPQETILDRRNRLLLWTLLETGALVSEVARLRYDQIHGEKRPTIKFLSPGGEGARDVEVSDALARALREFGRRKGAGEWAFNGFTRGGPLGGPISPRGIELLVRAFASQVGLEKNPALIVTPRTFRHSRVLDWLQQGVAREEVQRRLGLRTAYAFRALEPLLSNPATQPHPAGK